MMPPMTAYSVLSISQLISAICYHTAFGCLLPSDGMGYGEAGSSQLECSQINNAAAANGRVYKVRRFSISYFRLRLIIHL